MFSIYWLKLIPLPYFSSIAATAIENNTSIKGEVIKYDNNILSINSLGINREFFLQNDPDTTRNNLPTKVDYLKSGDDITLQINQSGDIQKISAHGLLDAQNHNFTGEISLLLLILFSIYILVRQTFVKN